jgi:hypothetical protein
LEEERWGRTGLGSGGVPLERAPAVPERADALPVAVRERQLRAPVSAHSTQRVVQLRARGVHRNGAAAPSRVQEAKARVARRVPRRGGVRLESFHGFGG